MQTIVLIDDEFYFRQAMKRYLSEWENEYRLIGEAKNGKEGLELILRHKPDIVLMDINMQIMSGLDAMQIIAGKKIPSKVILVTGYSEFEYAHQAIRFGVFDYLLKPIDKLDLKKCLDRATAQIEAEKRNRELRDKYHSASFKVKEFFVNKIFSAKREIDLIEAEQMAIGFLNLEEPFCCQAFLINIGVEEEEYNEEKGLSLYHFAMSNVLTELFERKGIQCLTSGDNTNLCVVICGNMAVEELEHSLSEIQDEFQQFIQQMIDHPIQISVGSAREKLQEIWYSVQEAFKVQRFMRMYCKYGVCTIEQLEQKEDWIGSFREDWYAKFSMFVRTDNVLALETFVNDFFMEMKKNEERPEIVLQRAGNMVSCAYEVWQSFMSGDEKNRNRSEGHTLLDQPKFAEDSIDRIQEKVLQYTAEIMHMERARREKKKSALSANVARYIEKNYQRYDLSLMELSTTFGMSKTILCQQFKEAFRMTIGDYILQTRMRRAIEMLDEGYNNVTYVAEKCGYGDAGYFSKCFKKKYGISPKDYCENRVRVLHED